MKDIRGNSAQRTTFDLHGGRAPYAGRPNRMRDAVAGALLSLFAGVPTTAAAGALEDGLAAFDRENFGAAFNTLFPVAEAGNAEAQYRVGHMLDRGNGVRVDLALAAKWYRLAGAQGHAEAQYALGEMLLEGRGVVRDRHEALVLFRKAAGNGEPFSQVNLAWKLEAGHFGIPLDYKEAVMWYRRSADVESPVTIDAEAGLGRIHEWGGEGVAKDHAEAIKWYRKMLARSHGNAASLARMYAEGKGVKQDHGEALRLLRLAAAAGDLEAKARIGRIFHQGKGVPRDYAEALKWYRPVADLDSGPSDALSMAQAGLGAMYRRGEGLPQDFELAANWYRKAAGALSAEAQFELGAMYAEGAGVARDAVEAYRWLNLASGSPFTVDKELRAAAAKRRDDIAKHLAADAVARAQELTRKDGFFYSRSYMYGAPGMADDYAKALLVQHRAVRGDPIAQAEIGRVFADGTGVPKDHVVAHMWLNLAAARLKPEDRRRESAAALRDELTQRMTPASVSEAQKLARNWKPDE